MVQLQGWCFRIICGVAVASLSFVWLSAAPAPQARRGDGEQTRADDDVVALRALLSEDVVWAVVEQE